ncbi:MAG: imidazole glycerol phosphate synthase subunit HisH [Dehalococcoidales bacterium]|nr:imidazole glycerol phosphate synthase subunit HisH [Dehalococcoidales bacterium]
MITIIDYGAGNIRSVFNAISTLGQQAIVTNSPGDVLTAEAIILPGVGAAGDVMKNLEASGLITPLRLFIENNRPFLGICIGMQLLFTYTEEDKGQQCLDIIPGRVRRLSPGVKIPQIGWNQVNQKSLHPIFDGIPNRSNFYFAHSYYARPEDESLVIGEAEYGISICSVITRGNLVATQFHPEKSGEVGLKIYNNFIKLALAHRVFDI